MRTRLVERVAVGRHVHQLHPVVRQGEGVRRLHDGAGIGEGRRDDVEADAAAEVVAVVAPDGAAVVRARVPGAALVAVVHDARDRAGQRVRGGVVEEVVARAGRHTLLRRGEPAEDVAVGQLARSRGGRSIVGAEDVWGESVWIARWPSCRDGLTGIEEAEVAVVGLEVADGMGDRKIRHELIPLGSCDSKVAVEGVPVVCDKRNLFAETFIGTSINMFMGTSIGTFIGMSIGTSNETSIGTSIAKPIGTSVLTCIGKFIGLSPSAHRYGMSEL